MKNTIFILDDHAIIRSGLTAYIESHSDWRVIGSAEDAESTLSFLEGRAKKSAENLPEIIILDLQLKSELSFDLLQTISEKFPSVKSVAFTMFDTTGFILTAKKCGAKGYVTKTMSEEELLDCLKKVSDGEECFPLVKEKQEKITRAEQQLALLTKQQRRVYQEILMGKTNEEIAENMNLKLHPVTNVSFYEIMAFCNRLSLKFGLTPVYQIKKKTNPDDWGAIPSAKDKDWEKYKIDKKANGFRIAEKSATESLKSTVSRNNMTSALKSVAEKHTNVSEVFFNGKKLSSGLELWEKSGNYAFCVQR